MASARQPAKAANSSGELKNYTLGERIGQDELTTVYRARHQTLEREVHVNILRRSGWIAVSRFQLAARIAARLQHPHILPVLDAGHDEQWGYYFVTPPIDATPLQTLLDKGPLDPPLALRIFANIGQALDYLHKEQVVHRDVQPQTILIAGDGRALLTGFSLAATPDGPDLSQLAEADYLTPYAAPEQTFEERSPAPALDIYALGAVLYHMLTGMVPPGLGGEPVSLVTLDPRLAPADRVVRRMLAPQPQMRYPSAAQAAAALRGALRPALGEDKHSTPVADGPVEGNWLENPLEIVLRDRINPDFLSRSRRRAEDLHHGEGVRRLLDAWSADKPQRRRQLGQHMRIDQVVSYNVYFYDLKILYETRTVPQTRERPYSGSKVSHRERELDRWKVAVDTPNISNVPFAEVGETEVFVPNTEKSLVCPRCQGQAKMACLRCQGRGTLDVKRTITKPGSSYTEIEVVDCPECAGAAVLPCERCDATGGLLEQKMFLASRRGRLWQNTDDLEGLPQRTIEQRSEEVFLGAVDVHDPIWHAVQPLHELFEEATKLERDDTRIIESELTIRAAPVTEVDYTLRNKPRTLAVIGFDQGIKGDLSLLDTERLLFVAAAVVIVVLVMILLLSRG